MDVEGLKKRAVEPFNEMWKMLWKYFKWGGRSQEEWDSLMDEFNRYAETYRNSPLSYMVDMMTVTYLNILQWGDMEGNRKRPNFMWCLNPQTKEEIVKLINEAERGDEIIIKGTEKSISTRIK